MEIIKSLKTCSVDPQFYPMTLAYILGVSIAPSLIDMGSGPLCLALSVFEPCLSSPVVRFYIRSILNCDHGQILGSYFATGYHGQILGSSLLNDRNEASIKVSIRMEFIMGAHSNSEHLSLFWSYLPHADSKSYTVSFVGFLNL